MGRRNLAHLLDMTDKITYFLTTQPYGWMSNFYKCKITSKNGLVWSHSEAMYQACKFADPAIREQIRNCEAPKEAARLGRLLQPVRNNWNNIRVPLMGRILLIKISQYDWMKKELIETGNAYIEALSKKDSFWESGPNRDGQNIMGKLWMKIRDDIINNKSLDNS